MVINWLWNNIESTVSTNFIFLDAAKEIWEAVIDTNFIRLKASRDFEVYEDLFVSDKAKRL